MGERFVFSVLLWTAATAHGFVVADIDAAAGLSLLQTTATVGITPRQTPTAPTISVGAAEAASSAGLGSLHRVVGTDGVLMLGLARSPERFQLAAGAFGGVGVVPARFDATDGHAATAEELALGCLPAAEVTPPSCDGKLGKGCAFPTLQAIADSHRRALLQAAERGEEWTAILEDDVVPVDPDRWDAGFAAAWAALPANITLVRLQFRLGTPGELFRDTGHGFRLLTGRDPGGGCTGGYLVHRTAIEELLALFPCCGPVDACFEELYRRKDDSGKTWALRHMMLMDSTEVGRLAANVTRVAVDQQRGVMVQNKVDLVSARDLDRRALTKSAAKHV